MRKKLITLCAIVVSGTSFADSGIYANANVGADTNSGDVAYNANAGYMLNSYFGLEAGYTGANTNYWDLALKGVLPIPVVDIYGKLGMSYVATSGFNAGAVMYGAGISIPIFPMLQINVEDYAISNATTQNFLMAGLQIKF